MELLTGPSGRRPARPAVVAPSVVVRGTRRAFADLLCVMASILWIGGCALVPRPRPNVLFLMVDALRSDHLGFSGYSRPTSPCLDALASEGTAFTTSTAQAPFTMTSVPSLLSGRYPGSAFRWTSVDLPDKGNQWAVAVGEGVGLLPSYLGRRGYSTAAFVANPVAAAQILGLREQFDHFDDTLKHLWTLDSAERLNRRALSWITSVGEAPWFCYLHYMDVHDPYYPPPEFAAPFTNAYYDFPEPSRPWMNDLLAEGGPTPDELRHIKAMYDGEIGYLDGQICALLDSLAAMGMTQQLLLVVAADHGEEFLEHGSLGHGQSLYQELVRCPLLFWSPGRVPRGRRIDTPVENVDIVPTVLDLAGVPRPAGIEGRSLVPSFQGSISPRPVFSQNQGFAVRRGRWKLWHRPDGRTSLYDLAVDSLETADLGLVFPDTVASLVSDLKTWRQKIRRPPMPESARAPAGMGAETERLLRQLGYIE